jgi:hypothetical protein
MALTDNGCGCARPSRALHDSPNTSPPGEGPAVLHCIRSHGPWRRLARQRRGMRRRSHDPRVAASPAADCDKAPADAGAVVRSWDLGFQAREPPVPAPLTRLRDCVKPHRTPIRNGFTRMCAGAFSPAWYCPSAPDVCPGQRALADRWASVRHPDERVPKVIETSSGRSKSSQIPFELWPASRYLPVSGRNQRLQLQPKWCHGGMPRLAGNAFCIYWRQP